MLTISSIAVSPVPPQAPAAKAQPVLPVKPSLAVSSENAGVSVVVSQGGDGGSSAAVYAPPAFPPVNPSGQMPAVEVQKNAAVPEQNGARGVAAPAAAALAASGVAAAAQPATAPAEADAAVASAANNPANASDEAAAAQEEQQTQRQQADQAARDQQARAQAQRFKGQLPVEVKSPVEEAMDTQIKELLPNMWKASRAAVDVLIGEEARAAAAARAEALAPVPEVPTERALEATENYARTGGAEPASPGSTVSQLV